MRKFIYNWLHLLSDKKGVHCHKFNTRREFLEAMSEWNNDARWKYWEGDFGKVNVW